MKSKIFKFLLSLSICIVLIIASSPFVFADTVVYNDSFIYAALNTSFGYIPFGKVVRNTPAFGTYSAYFSHNYVSTYFRFRGSEIYVTAGTVIEFSFSMLEPAGVGYKLNVSQMGDVAPISKTRLDTDYFVRYGGRFTATTSGYYTFQYYSSTGEMDLFSAQIYFDNSPVILNTINSAVDQILGNQNATAESIRVTQNATAQAIQDNQNSNTDRLINAGSDKAQPDFDSTNGQLDDTVGQIESIEGSYQIDQAATNTALSTGSSFLQGSDMQRASIQVKTWIERFSSENRVVTGFLIAAMVLGLCFWVIGRKAWSK